MEIINVLFFALSTALLSIFLDFCLGDISKDKFSEGRIFSPIGRLILNLYESFEAKEELRLNPEEPVIDKDADDTDKFLAEIGVKTKIKGPPWRRANPWKIFGVCPICSNVWLGLIFAPILFHLGYFGLIFFIPFLVISNYLLRLLTRTLP